MSEPGKEKGDLNSPSPLDVVDATPNDKRMNYPSNDEVANPSSNEDIVNLSLNDLKNDTPLNDEDISPLSKDENVDSLLKNDETNLLPNKKSSQISKKREINLSRGNEETNPSPNLKRKLKINRRNFYLENHPIMQLPTEKSDKNKSSSANGLEKEENKIKTDSFQKKIISLRSVKSNSPPISNPEKKNGSSTIIKLKTSSSNLVEKRNENSLRTALTFIRCFACVEVLKGVSKITAKNIIQCGFKLK